jgi:hypothetical protein
MRVVGALAVLALSLAAFPALATTFTAGEFVTFSQGDWGETPAGGNVGAMLENNYNSIFAPSDLLEVGIHGSAGFSIIFDNPDDLIAYLPSNGTAGALTADLLDPASSASGVFGGEVAALALNIAFSDAGLLAHPAGVPFGDLVLQNLDMLAAYEGDPDIGPEITELDGMSLRELLSEADLVLGGATTPFNPDEMAEIVGSTNMVFDDGFTFTFDKFLAFPPSTELTVPEPSTWAMLLIGFAVLGLVRFRASRGGRASAH